AALRGKPVGFYAAGPWSGPWRTAVPDTTHDVLYFGSLGVLVVAIILGAALLARRNLIQGRGDRRGAMRPAFWVLRGQVALWMTVARLQQVWMYGQGIGRPDLDHPDILTGFRSTLGLCIGSVPHSIRDALFGFFLIFLLRVLLRKAWLAGLAYALLFTVLQCL